MLYKFTFFTFYDPVHTLAVTAVRLQVFRGGAVGEVLYSYISKIVKS